MTYQSRETSVYSGAPVELYKFTYGLITYLYTSSDTAVVYNGDTYATEPISRNGIDQSQEDLAGSIEVTLTRENAVGKLYRAFLPSTPVSVQIFRYHRGDAETVCIFKGAVSTCAYSDGQATLTCVPSTEALRRSIPVVAYQAQCNRVLYSKTKQYARSASPHVTPWQLESTGCNVDKELFKVTGAVVAFSGANLTVQEASGKPDGWFSTGYVERITGERRWIIQHTGTTLTLANQFESLNIGETLSMYAGCDRLEDTCDTKFNNVINFEGFSRIPTKNPFNSSIAQ